MTQRKPKVLMVNEASYLTTGYATYGREILSRLHKTDKFEIAEFASYGHSLDPRSHDIPWLFYGNGPNVHNPKEVEEHNSSPFIQFGTWRFEEVLLDFKADICLDVRDHWMLSFEETSPFRNFYHWAIMPTCDSLPQDETWVSTFCNADSVYTYSDWAAEVLRHQGKERINVVRSHPPGSNPEVFKPVTNKREHKAKLTLSPDSFIIGTIMRNQKRKLYPDLFEAFRELLNELPPEQSKHLFLYCHTSYPDGWRLARLIKEIGIGHRVLFTYLCRKCGVAFPALFQDAKTTCLGCGANEAFMPNTQFGVTSESLAGIINCFDVYTQYANSEGAGMPQIDAASCGVPIIATDYSAMSDISRKLCGYPIKVLHLAREAETHAYRAIPDRQHFKQIVTQLMKLPESVRLTKGMQARQSVLKHYTWDQTAKFWEEAFEKIPLKDPKTTWESPARLFTTGQSLPNNISNDQFVNWAIDNILGLPQYKNTFYAMCLTRDLNYGTKISGLGGNSISDASLLGLQQKWEPVTRESVAQELYNIRQNFNKWEQRRCNPNIKKPDYIILARQMYELHKKAGA
jgi:glycosyltransferase involved in cell wall biosynthesis